LGEEARKTGIGCVGDLPWGTHLCHFYETKSDLLDLLVPYFKAGLEDNEFCPWMISDPLTEEEVWDALGQAVPDLERYRAEQRVEIISQVEPRLKGGAFDLSRVIKGWNEKLKHALARGCDGLRVNANMSLLHMENWRAFHDYEIDLHEAIADKRMILMCSFQVAATGAAELLDVAGTHHFAVSKRHGFWEVVNLSELKQARQEIKRLNEELDQRVVERVSELGRMDEELKNKTAERKRAEEAMHRSERRFRAAFDNAPIGMALTSPYGHWSKVNRAFCEMLGYSEQELLEINFQSVTHRDDLEANLEGYRQLLAGESNSLNMEERFFHKDGRIVWANLSATVIRGAEGNPIYLVTQIQDITERKRAEAVLADYTRRLQTLSGRLLEAQETERRRIARELHDEIGQSLTAIKIRLRALQRRSKTGLPNLDECIRIVDQSLSQVQSLSLDLRPPQLDDLGLSAALRWHLDRQAQASRLIPHFSSDPLPGRLYPDIEIACFRVAQEALTNIIRHAHAHQVRIELRRRGTELHLMIQDDGQGFDTDTARGAANQGASMGLIGMQERAELAVGRFELKSFPGRGTQVHAVFPLAVTAPRTRSKQRES
jgi:PAS domain S-box-containing protein